MLEEFVCGSSPYSIRLEEDIELHCLARDRANAEGGDLAAVGVRPEFLEYSQWSCSAVYGRNCDV